MRQNSGIDTPDQSRWRKNSFLSLPKKPSIAELSGLPPFLDIDPTSPCFSQMAILCFVKEIWANGHRELSSVRISGARFLSTYPSCIRACRTR